jgi:hypothetical protein
MKPRRFILRNEDIRRNAIRTIQDASIDKPIEVIIRKFVRHRTSNQNALYWVWIGIIANDTGHTADEIHEIFKGMFLTPITVEIGTKTREIAPSTTKLSTVDMSEYMERVRAFCAAELGLQLPDAHQEWAA